MVKKEPNKPDNEKATLNETPPNYDEITVVSKKKKKTGKSGDSKRK